MPFKVSGRGADRHTLMAKLARHQVSKVIEQADPDCEVDTLTYQVDWAVLK